MQTVTLSLFRFESLRGRLWAFSMMGRGRWPVSRLPGIGFWKLCGSGTGEGFLPAPNWNVYAILAAWESEGAARNAVSGARLFRRYRARAAESVTLFMAPLSSRGRWSGRAPFHPDGDAPPGPIASLTRATLRTRTSPRFWQRVPGIEDVIGSDPNVLLKIGIGELPLLRQVTFSVWPDESAMAAFARRPGGPHAAAIRAVREGGWFREELYTRFAVTDAVGEWSDAPRLFQYLAEPRAAA